MRDDPLSVPSLARSSAVVGLGTSISRVSGLVRLFATAYAIGTTRLTDTYTLANTTPNIVYELVLGGVLSATLVPVFVAHRESKDEEGTSAVVSVAAVLLTVVSVIGFIAAPLIVKLFTIGVEQGVAADQEEVATSLLRLFMPQMLFYGLTALATALLNARRKFAAAAFAPALNNLLVSLVLFSLPVLAGRKPDLQQVRDEPLLLLTLGLGTTAGIVAMTVVLWPPLRRAGVHLRFRFDWRNPAVRQVGRLSGWTLGYVLCNQVSLLVVLILLNNRQAGGVSAYTYAFIFFQLPHALFAVSIMTTLVPELSAAAGRGDSRRYRERFSTGLRLMALVVLPAAVGYMVLAKPIVIALLKYGAFGASAADLVSESLAAFGAGLFGFSVYLFALRGFYALHDTRTPFLLNVFQNIVQIAFAFVFDAAFGVPGLALAYGAAYTVAAVAALVLLRRRVGRLDAHRVARTVAKVLVACVAMAVAVVVVSRVVGSSDGFGALLRTVAGVAAGGLVYVVAVLVLRVEEVDMLRARLLKSRTRPTLE